MGKLALAPETHRTDEGKQFLRTEFILGASPRSLLLERMLRMLRPITGVGALVPRISPTGDLPPMEFTDLAGVLLPARRGSQVRRVGVRPGYPADSVTASGVADDAPVLLHFHGGSLRFGGLRTYRRVGSNISALTGCRVFVPGFRQMPRTSFADVLSDALPAYRHLLDAGVAPGRIVVIGDSGGAQMAMQAVLDARDEGLPMPAGVVLISPWVDFESASKRAHTNFRRDPLVSPRLVDLIDYWVQRGILQPELGAIRRNPKGLPPALIQAGSTEMTVADSELLARRLAAAGVACRLQLWDRQVHIFPLLSDVLPDGRTAMADIKAFIDEVCTRRPATVPSQHLTQGVS